MLKWIVCLLFCSFVLAEGNVVALTPDTFDNVIDGSKYALVEFYAPWCGHCKNLAPTYEELGDAFAKAKDQIVIAKVDADAHQDLGSRFRVTGFPSLKWIPKSNKGSFKAEEGAEDYKGGRTLDDLANFIQTKTQIKPNIVKPESFVKVLGSDFDEIVKESENHVFVEFYAPWCTHCKNLAPIYEAVAKAFRTEKNCIVANLDATVHKSIADEHGVTGFPSLKFFKNGQKSQPIDYTTERSEEALIDFINEHCGTHRLPGGALKPEAGLVSSLDELVKEFLGASKGKQTEVASKVAKQIKSLNDKYAPYYVKVMEKIATKGLGYVSDEMERLSKIINSGATSPEKIDSFYIRRNILTLFTQPSDSEPSDQVKDEL